MVIQSVSTDPCIPFTHILYIATPELARNDESYALGRDLVEYKVISFST